MYITSIMPTHIPSYLLTQALVSVAMKNLNLGVTVIRASVCSYIQYLHITSM